MPTPSPANLNQQQIEQASRHWFEHVVLGLNLCPFAHRPARQQRIHFTVSMALSEENLISTLLEEISTLESIPIEIRETTLIIIPTLLGDFYDYQFFLEEAQRQLKQKQWQTTFQLASFHPDYCFTGAEPEDSSNLSNRSPFPIIHILRQESLNTVLSSDDDASTIIERNIDTLSNLSEEQKQALFPYIEANSRD